MIHTVLNVANFMISSNSLKYTLLLNEPLIFGLEPSLVDMVWCVFIVQTGILQLKEEEELFTTMDENMLCNFPHKNKIEAK